MTELWLVVGIGVVGMSVLALAVLSFHHYRLHKRLAAVEQLSHQQMDKVRQELAAINSAAIGVGQRLISAEKKLKAAVEKRDMQTFSQAGLESSQLAAYSMTVDSEKEAVSAQELVDRYGLSEAEANLLLLLKTHGAEREASSC